MIRLFNKKGGKDPSNPPKTKLVTKATQQNHYKSLYQQEAGHSEYDREYSIHLLFSQQSSS